jgi:hypothetical protein
MEVPSKMDPVMMHRWGLRAHEMQMGEGDYGTRNGGNERDQESSHYSRSAVEEEDSRSFDGKRTSALL